MTRRVHVLTSGHLCSCPRMLKAADALHDAGYDVQVISTNHMPESAAKDARIAAARRWRWRVVPYGRVASPGTWLRSGLRRKAALMATGADAGVPMAIAGRAIGRAHPELVQAAMETPADLIYAGTVGALAAAAEAGRRSGTPFAVDFEDFHCGEHVDEGDGRIFNALGRRVMIDTARDAAFVTAGSGAIAAECQQELGIGATPIHNVFPLPAVPPAIRQAPSAPLRLYWFSQTLGLRRGLQDVIRAAGMLGRPVELHLRAAIVPDSAVALQQLAAACAPHLTLRFLDLAPPEQMIDSCRDYDVGVSAEQGHVPNSALALSNKAATYLLAGLPAVLTDTPGQRPLARDMGPGAIVYTPGDAAALRDGLARLADNPAACRLASAAAWQAAHSRWHWEHRDERGALLRLVERVFA